MPTTTIPTTSVTTSSIAPAVCSGDTSQRRGVDDLLERARRTDAVPERQRLYCRFEDLLAEELVLVPLFHDVDYRVANPRGARPPAVELVAIRQLRADRQGRGAGTAAAALCEGARFTCRSRVASRRSIR